MLDSKYAVARPSLRPLYALENRLDEALYSGQGYKIVAHSLTELERYSQRHACDLFDRSGAYTQGAPNSISFLYQQLAYQVSEWVCEYKDGVNVLTGELLYFLRNWLNRHRQLSLLEQRF